jgi:AraC-like DNA-binding protein
MNLDQSITYLFSGSFLLIVALVTSFKHRQGDRTANFFLTAYFWNYTIAVFITSAVLFGLAEKWPHLYRIGIIPGFFVMPFSYLYVARKLFGRHLKLIDLHLLPLVIFLVDYAPFLMLSANEKWKLYQAELPNPVRLKLAFSEGWFMPDFGHAILRYVAIIGYWLAEVVLITRAMRNPDHPLPNQEPNNWRWLQLLIGSQILIIIPPLLAALFGNDRTVSNWINVAALIASVVQCYYLFFHPEVLYSLNTALVQPLPTNTSADYLQTAVSEPVSFVNTVNEEDLPAQPLPNFQLSEDALDEIEQQLALVMETKKPFQKPRYGIRDLSTDSGIPIHRISAFINKRCGQNFYRYLNQYRIQFCLAKLDAGDHEKKTLEAIAGECGFQSRSTFIRAFKNVTGKTPSEYIADQA